MDRALDAVPDELARLVRNVVVLVEPDAPADDRASVLSLNALGFRLAFVACGPAIGALVDRIGLEPALGVLAAAFGLALAAALGVFVRAHPAA